MLLASPACLIQDIVLTTSPEDGGPPSCEPRWRLDPDLGDCVPCEYRTPHPTLACICGFEWVPADLPYCDDEVAYYECLPCTGTIDDCPAFTPDSSYGGIGTSTNCGRLAACCDELALDSGSTPCCGAGTLLRCAVDNPDLPEGAATVSCEPEASCCLGGLCPNGDTDCRGNPDWQSCVDGRCTPACQPDVEECCIGCACNCKTVVNPP
jgi:hypothetical protein